jgi:hypothetical protein
LVSVLLAHRPVARRGLDLWGWGPIAKRPALPGALVLMASMVDGLIALGIGWWRDDG